MQCHDDDGVVITNCVWEAAKCFERNEHPKVKVQTVQQTCL